MEELMPEKDAFLIFSLSEYNRKSGSPALVSPFLSLPTVIPVTFLEPFFDS